MIWEELEEGIYGLGPRLTRFGRKWEGVPMTKTKNKTQPSASKASPTLQQRSGVIRRLDGNSLFSLPGYPYASTRGGLQAKGQSDSPLRVRTMTLVFVCFATSSSPGKRAGQLTFNFRSSSTMSARASFAILIFLSSPGHSYSKSLERGDSLASGEGCAVNLAA